MYVIIASVEGPSQARETERLTTLLRGAALPSDGLEHIYAEDAEDRTSLVMFILADALEEAERSARGMCDRLLAGGPGLAGCALGRVVGIEGLI